LRTAALAVAHLAGGLGSGRRRAELHPGAARLGKADGDRLLRRAGAVLAFANVANLLADEFARLRGRRFTCARFSSRAFYGAFSGMGSPFSLAVNLPKLAFGTFQHLALRGRQALAAAIDVEVKHRHRRAERRALAAPAALRRALQRQRDRARASLGENPLFEVERVARAHDVRGPSLAASHAAHPSKRRAGSRRKGVRTLFFEKGS